MSGSQLGGENPLEARRARQDLGWLASSGALPRKRKMITGIDASSTLALQAHVYEMAERTKAIASEDGMEHGVRRTALPSDLLGPSNEGVHARDKQDKLHTKSVANRASECQAALERKAALYEKLARGEADDEQEQYEVDFFRKAWMEGGSKDADSHGAQDRQRSASPSTSQPLGKHHQAQYDNQFYYQYSQQQGAPHPSQLQGMYMQYAQHRQHPQQQQQPVDTAHLAVQGSGGMMSSDMSRERERRAWEAAERQRAVQEEEQEEKRKRARQEVLALGKATREQRERSEAVRAAQAAAAKSKQDKLKAAFMKKLMGQTQAKGS